MVFKLISTQYQFCNPTARFPQCTKLDALGPVSKQADELSFNARQNVTASLIAGALRTYNDMSLVSESYPPPLRAYNEIDGWLSQGLPPNQWEIEVQGWEAYILSTIQQTMASYAIGPGVEFSSSVGKPTNAMEQELCGRQKMQAPNGFKYALGIDVLCV